jgi:hypothetical protein
MGVYEKRRAEIGGTTRRTLLHTPPVPIYHLSMPVAACASRLARFPAGLYCADLLLQTPGFLFIYARPAGRPASYVRSCSNAFLGPLVGCQGSVEQADIRR